MQINNHDLIVSIVKRGYAERIVRASKSAGAEGATILHGRGTGIHEQKKLLGITIEPEKDIVLTVIHRDKTDAVLAAINEAGEMNKPGTGIAFVLELKTVAGITHLLKAQQD
ncbi:MAG: P-II family nitrogen regulator [Firmicutes bacterium]|nr:P-II family nitrogen regulator [Bacillota bacterium]